MVGQAHGGRAAPFDVVREPNDGRLRNVVVAHQSALNLRAAQPVPAHIDDVWAEEGVKMPQWLRVNVNVFSLGLSNATEEQQVYSAI